MPVFISNTDRILSDPTACQQHQMDIKILDQASENEPEFKQQPGSKGITINMVSHFLILSLLQEIGVGVFDVAEDPTLAVKPKGLIDDQLPAGMGYHQMSTIPIVRKLKGD